MYYLLFGANGEGERGAHSFLSAHATREAANAAALALPFVTKGHMSAWVHLAEFDGHAMIVTHWLSIPGTEWAESHELTWIAYG